jgi:hypothetical protein
MLRFWCKLYWQGQISPTPILGEPGKDTPSGESENGIRFGHPRKSHLFIFIKDEFIQLSPTIGANIPSLDFGVVPRNHFGFLVYYPPVPVVQWIEPRFPKPLIRVRLPAGAPALDSIVYKG